MRRNKDGVQQKKSKMGLMELLSIRELMVNNMGFDSEDDTVVAKEIARHVQTLHEPPRRELVQQHTRKMHTLKLQRMELCLLHRMRLIEHMEKQIGVTSETFPSLFAHLTQKQIRLMGKLNEVRELLGVASKTHVHRNPKFELERSAREGARTDEDTLTDQQLVDYLCTHMRR
jgi:hypothetical protein